jgi:AcrR family transcriptional regulator
VFAEQGIAGTTIDDVASAAGFTKGAFYSNFASKDELIIDLIDERVTDRLNWGAEALRADALSPGERVEALGNRLTAIFAEQREWQMLFIEFWQQAVRRPEVGERFAQRRRELRAKVADALEEHTEMLGLTPKLPYAQLATVILALSNGLAIEHYPDEEAVPDRLFGDILRLLLTTDSATADLAADQAAGPHP